MMLGHGGRRPGTWNWNLSVFDVAAGIVAFSAIIGVVTGAYYLVVWFLGGPLPIPPGGA